jgi:hypothetical protein
MAAGDDGVAMMVRWALMDLIVAGQFPLAKKSRSTSREGLVEREHLPERVWPLDRLLTPVSVSSRPSWPAGSACLPAEPRWYQPQAEYAQAAGWSLPVAGYVQPAVLAGSLSLAPRGASVAAS